MMKSPWLIMDDHGLFRKKNMTLSGRSDFDVRFQGGEFTHPVCQVAHIRDETIERLVNFSHDHNLRRPMEVQCRPMYPMDPHGNDSHSYGKWPIYS